MGLKYFKQIDGGEKSSNESINVDPLLTSDFVTLSYFILGPSSVTTAEKNKEKVPVEYDHSKWFDSNFENISRISDSKALQILVNQKPFQALLSDLNIDESTEFIKFVLSVILESLPTRDLIDNAIERNCKLNEWPEFAGKSSSSHFKTNLGGVFFLGLSRPAASFVLGDLLPLMKHCGKDEILTAIAKSIKKRHSIY